MPRITVRRLFARTMLTIQTSPLPAQAPDQRVGWHFARSEAEQSKRSFNLGHLLSAELLCVGQQHQLAASCVGRHGGNSEHLWQGRRAERRCR